MEVAKKRGRPPKNGVGAAASSGPALPTIPKKRGRPSKLVKGRGRPPKNPVLDGGTDDEVEEGEVGANGNADASKSLLSESSSEGSESTTEDKPKKSPKQAKVASAGKRRKLGRPKKHQPSDGDDSDNDDDDERRPVGRPATGAVNLNIVRTGRGPGRPKKDVGAKRPAAASEANGDVPAPKKRGRPALGNKPPAIPSGKPRGRPKANKSPSGGGDDEDDEEQDVDGDAGDSDAEVVPTPKKRGRPALSTKVSSAGKPRGRPKKAPASNDDEQDSQSAKERDDDETGGDLTEGGGGSGGGGIPTPKKRGRPAKAGTAGGAVKPRSGNSHLSPSDDNEDGESKASAADNKSMGLRLTDEEDNDSSGAGLVGGDVSGSAGHSDAKEKKDSPEKLPSYRQSAAKLDGEDDSVEEIDDDA